MVHNQDPAPAQHELEMVTLEELVPKDHLLRLIDYHILQELIDSGQISALEAKATKKAWGCKPSRISKDKKCK